MITGLTTLDQADDDGWTALDFAAFRGCAEAVQMLVAAGARVDAPPHATTPLMHCCVGGESEGHLRCARELLGAGADACALNACGESALSRASYMGQSHMVGLLLASGCPADVPGDHAQPPLWLAASRGHHKVCAQLLAAGCTIDALHQGRTALLVAALGKHATVVQLLLDCGADVLALSSEGKSVRQLELPLRDHIVALLEAAEARAASARATRARPPSHAEQLRQQKAAAAAALEQGEEGTAAVGRGVEDEGGTGAGPSSEVAAERDVLALEAQLAAALQERDEARAFVTAAEQELAGTRQGGLDVVVAAERELELARRQLAALQGERDSLSEALAAARREAREARKAAAAAHRELAAAWREAELDWAAAPRTPPHEDSHSMATATQLQVEELRRELEASKAHVADLQREAASAAAGECERAALHPVAAPLRQCAAEAFLELAALVPRLSALVQQGPTAQSALSALGVASGSGPGMAQASALVLHDGVEHVCVRACSACALKQESDCRGGDSQARPLVQTRLLCARSF